MLFLRNWFGLVISLRWFSELWFRTEKDSYFAWEFWFLLRNLERENPVSCWFSRLQLWHSFVLWCLILLIVTWNSSEDTIQNMFGCHGNFWRLRWEINLFLSPLFFPLCFFSTLWKMIVIEPLFNYYYFLNVNSIIVKWLLLNLNLIIF